MTTTDKPIVGVGIAFAFIPIAIFALVRRDELTDAVATTAVREPQPALAGAS